MRHSAKILIAGMLALLPAVGSAQTREQVDACQPDAERYCQQVGTEQSRVAQCLGQNFRRLSPACRRILRFGTVQNVCAGPIARYCRSAGDNSQAVVACLQSAPGVSGSCRNALRSLGR